MVLQKKPVWFPLTLVFASLAGASTPARGQLDPRTDYNIEAGAFVPLSRWQIVPSQGSPTYRVHVKAALIHGRSSGQFEIKFPTPLVGKVTTLDIVQHSPMTFGVNGIPGPTSARISGACRIQGRIYQVEMKLVQDGRIQGSRPGDPKRVIPGSFFVVVISTPDRPGQPRQTADRYVIRGMVRTHIQLIAHPPKGTAGSAGADGAPVTHWYRQNP